MRSCLPFLAILVASNTELVLRELRSIVEEKFLTGLDEFACSIQSDPEHCINHDDSGVKVGLLFDGVIDEAYLATKDGTIDLLCVV